MTNSGNISASESAQPPSPVLETLSRRQLLEAAEAYRQLEQREEVRRILDGHNGTPGPLYWLQNHTETFDEKWLSSGLEPHRKFPTLPYLPWLFDHFVKDRQLFVPKCPRNARFLERRRGHAGLPRRH